RGDGRDRRDRDRRRDRHRRPPRHPDRGVRRALPGRRVPCPAAPTQRRGASPRRRRRVTCLWHGGTRPSDGHRGSHHWRDGRLVAAGDCVRQRVRRDIVVGDVQPARDLAAPDHAPSPGRRRQLGNFHSPPCPGGRRRRRREGVPGLAPASRGDRIGGNPSAENYPYTPSQGPHSIPPPPSIPCPGAATFQRQHPTTAVNQVEIGIAGPSAGTIWMTVAWILYGATQQTVSLLAASIGLFLNLFNLIPVW